jgi:signal transduction histidine kinase/streptogramin lyase
MMLAIVLFCLLLCAAPMLAQVAQPLPSYLRHPYRFRHVNTEHGGLSQNTVFAALQDRKGFLWIATGDGLNRYDGYTCKVFRHNPGDSTTISAHLITALMEDNEGNIWCGTENGINRFIPQTSTFQRYYSDHFSMTRKPDACSYHSILESKQHCIWVCTNKGIMRVDRLSQTLVPIRFKNGMETRFYDRECQYLSNFHKKPLVRTWIEATKTAEVWEIDADAETCIHRQWKPDRIPNTTLYPTCMDNNGVFWLTGKVDIRGKEETMWTYNPLTNDLKQQMETNATPMTMRVARQDSYGHYWFVASNVLRIVNPNAQQIDSIMYRPDESSGLASPNLLAGSSMEYSNGKRFISTDGGGINLFLPKPKFTHIRRIQKAGFQQLNSNMLWGMAEDSLGYVWIASIGGGINRFNPSTGEIRSFLDKQIIRAVFCDKNGVVWAADEEQSSIIHIEKLDSEQPVIRSITVPMTSRLKTIISITQDRFGALWLANLYDNCVFRFDPITQKFTHTFPNLGTTLQVDSKGRIWAGDEGITIFDPADADRIRFSGKDSTPQLFTRFRHDPNNPNSLADNTIKHFHEDTDGTMWIATIRGLDHFDPATKRFTHYNESNGMPNSYVYGILPDDNGNLWVSTNRGLSKFNKVAKKWRNYSPYDGLQSYEFDRSSFVRLRKGGTDGRMKGWMLFGGVNGFNIFHPDSVRDNPEKPSVAITNILINEKPYSDLWRGFAKDVPQHAIAEVSELTALELGWNDNTLAFEFAALEFTDPEKNEYAYQMEGIDKGWVQAGTLRTARYAGLQAGDYVFRVKACNNDGVWNEVGTSLRVRIVPPFWRTAWFYGLLLVGGVGIVVGTTRTISRQRFKRELALTTERLEAAQLLETERLEQELALQRERLEKEIALEKERGRISQDLHDELGPGMTKILLLSSSTSPDGMNAQEITTTAQEVIHSMAGVIWLTRPENDTVRNLVAYLREYATDYLGKASITLDFVHPPDIPDIAIEGAVRRSIFLVIKEALNNVVKHSGASTVRLTIEFPSKNRFIACVEDNGRGFAHDEVRRFGNGLRNMQRRMEDNGGTCSIASNQASEGTTVRLEAAW